MQTALSPTATSDVIAPVSKGPTKASTSQAKKGKKVKPSPTYTLHFPPVELCTDNAAMIAWAGWEMHNAGWETELDVQPFRKWSLEEKKETGKNEANTPVPKGHVYPRKSEGKADVVDDPNNEIRSENGWGILTVKGWRQRRSSEDSAKELGRAEKDSVPSSKSKGKVSKKSKHFDKDFSTLSPLQMKEQSEFV